MRRLIFLDVDGVLNDHAFNEEAQSCTLKPDCVSQLNRILRAVPEVTVVLSSAWRYLLFRGVMTLPGFQHMLQTHGVSARIRSVLLGVTAADEAIPTRGRQIQDWLDRDIYPLTSFVVLDDAPEGMCFRPVEDRLVKTDGKVGLTAADANRVIAMLMGDM